MNTAPIKDGFAPVETSLFKPDKRFMRTRASTRTERNAGHLKGQFQEICQDGKRELRRWDYLLAEGFRIAGVKSMVLLGLLFNLFS